MAATNLKEWAVEFLSALSNFNNQVKIYNQTLNRRDRKFEKIYGSSYGRALQQLKTVCAQLPSLLPSKNSVQAVNELNKLIQTIDSDQRPAGRNLVSSLYEQFTKWYETYIKPLL